MSRTPRLLTHTSSYLCAGSRWGFVLMLAACGGDSDSPTAPGEPVASVTISPATASLLLGEASEFTASAETANGQQVPEMTFTWTSSDMSVATVSAEGRVTAVGGGSATITAATEGKSRTADVTVIVLTFASVSAGQFHTCGLTPSGEAHCWGRSYYGQLGTGDAANSAIPAAVSNGISFAQLTTQVWHTCGLTASGEAYCWGYNASGELGNGSTTGEDANPTPFAVSGGLTFASLSAGSHHTCGLTPSSEAYCWGANESGQLGTGSGRLSATPMAVSGDLVFESLAAGLRNTCGLTPNGEAYCWGSNDDGKLGNGTTVHSATPEAVSGGITFASLAVGFRHTCGLTPNGEAYCWGGSFHGQLGNGSFADGPNPTPLAVSGGLTFASLSLGSVHTCGVTTGDDAYCWGNNLQAGPRLGDGTYSKRATPVLVFGQH